MLHPPYSISLHPSLYHYISDFFSGAVFDRTQHAMPCHAHHPISSFPKEKKIGGDKEMWLYNQMHTHRVKIEEEEEREGEEDRKKAPRR